MIEIRKNVQAGETPPQISVMQIDQDLKDGISKSDMAVKYGIKPWEVDEMFKHPFLKGRRPSRKKALSFTFVDDTADYEDPNQVTLEEAINEAKEVTEAAIDTFANTTKQVVEILSPTLETPLETIQAVTNESPDPIDTPEITGIPDGDKLSDTEDEEEVTPVPWGENQDLKPIELEESDSFDM